MKSMLIVALVMGLATPALANFKIWENLPMSQDVYGDPKAGGCKSFDGDEEGSYAEFAPDGWGTGGEGFCKIKSIEKVGKVYQIKTLCSDGEGNYSPPLVNHTLKIVNSKTIILDGTRMVWCSYNHKNDNPYFRS